MPNDNSAGSSLVNHCQSTLKFPMWAFRAMEGWIDLFGALGLRRRWAVLDRSSGTLFVGAERSEAREPFVVLHGATVHLASSKGYECV
jgi:hypothetical protein